MSLTNQNIIGGAGGNQGGYTIERSVRLRSSASAYLNRTPSTTGTGATKTWTMSFWFKRGQLGVQQDLYSPFYGGDGFNESQMYFNSSDQFAIYDSSAGAGYMYYITTQVFRDPSAWYHFVIACDTTQATASNRLKIYVNGVQITSFNTSQTQNQNTNTGYNGTSLQRIGCYARSISSLTDGYFAEFNNIDGQALTPSDFGEYNADTGVWQPIAYTGTYGTNGFYLDFNDNTTTTTLAEDKSGNGNDWTANNISLTSGVTYDSMTDTPTIYAGGGNYCTLNPLSTGRTLSNGNLDYAGAASGITKGTVAVSSGKWYWEITAGNINSSAGVASVTVSPTTTYCGGTADSWCYFNSGNRYNNNASTSGYSSFTTNDIIGVALDMDNGKIYWSKNGTWQGSSDPAAGTNAAYTNLSGTITPANGNNTVNDSGTANFGQRPFAYTPPDGFKALHTGNLPDSNIVDGGEHFNAVLYTGNGSTQSITGVGFAPDLTWMKQRSGAQPHGVFDNLRGNGGALLRTNATDAENNGGFIDLTTDGFDVLISDPNWNGSGGTYVAWNWKANGAGVSNTDGSITSTVSANPTAGFSIVTYTGTGANTTVGHGLGDVPSMIIIKARQAANGVNRSWPTWHKSFSSTEVIFLDLTLGRSTGATTYWNSTLPTSSVFSLGVENNVNNATGGATPYVAYCFSEVEGYSKFGSYTGNGSADGTFVFTGFRPAFLLVKGSSVTSTWRLIDAVRSTFNEVDDVLAPNESSAELVDNSSLEWDFLSNGFKCRDSYVDLNQNGQTYIYLAFAEHPFKNALAR